MELVTDIYHLTRRLPQEERFVLGDQLRRAAISVPSNIAEGQQRQHPKEFIHFLSIYTRFARRTSYTSTDW